MVGRREHSVSAPERPDSEGAPSGTQGFSIVEIVVAVLVLAIGVLATAGTTVLVVRQTMVAEVTTTRAAAVRTTIESLKALPFDSVKDGSRSIGTFDVNWTITEDNRWKSVELVSLGPGLESKSGFPTLSRSVPDTAVYWVIR